MSFLCSETAQNGYSHSSVIEPLSTVADTSDYENITECEPAPELLKTSGGDSVAAWSGSSSEASLGSPDSIGATTADLEPRTGEEIDDITICCEDYPFVELGSTYLQYPFKLVHGEVQHSFAMVRFNAAGEACVRY
jgi:hypothetical protein